MPLLPNSPTKEEFCRVINKIKETFSRHKTRIDTLEGNLSLVLSKIEALEHKVEILDKDNNPWKMPFD